jgi:hypothetical protein
MSDPEDLFAQAAQKLKRTVREGRMFQAAQVKVVGLEDVRKAAGERWPLIQERVRTNSMTFIQAALGEGDIVIPCGDGFLVIYDENGDRDLNSETETVQNALNTFYMGEEALRAVRAKATPHVLTPREVVSFLASDAKEPTEENCQRAVRFSPVCNIAQEAITSYFAVPIIRDITPSLCGYNPNYRDTGRNEGCDFVEMDLALLEQAITEVTRVMDGPQRCLIGYCVHVTTLKNRSGRERLFERLRAAPLHVRKHLIGKIAEIDVGTPLSNIIEWVGLMRSFTAHVSLEFHHSERGFDGLDQTRAMAAGFRIPLPPVVTAETRARCRTLIARWRLGLQRQRMRLFIDGVNDPFVLTSAFSEAVDYVTSERHWPVVAQAAGVRPVSRIDIVGLLQKSA